MTPPGHGAPVSNEGANSFVGGKKTEEINDRVGRNAKLRQVVSQNDSMEMIVDKQTTEYRWKNEQQGEIERPASVCEAIYKPLDAESWSGLHLSPPL